MSKGFLQSSSCSSMNNQAPTSSSSLAVSLWHDDSCREQDLPPVSWSQLLLGGSLMSDFQKLVEDVGGEDHASTVVPESGYVCGSEEIKQLAEAAARASSWCRMDSNNPALAASLSPRIACVGTNSSSDMPGFSNSKAEKRHLDQPCDSKETGGAAAKKKIKVAQSTFKVRKEKLGDRIAVLHQLASPFGKTDTASVLLEAIGYIRFLQNQIEALSSPYLGSSGGSVCTRQPAVKGRNCIFPEDPGQVNDCSGELKDLRSRGLCLVPLSTCTSHIGGDTGADDHWAASLADGFLYGVSTEFQGRLEHVHLERPNMTL